MLVAAGVAGLVVAMSLMIVRAMIGPSHYDRILAANSFGTKTVLLIAHRLSTIEQADRIIVLDGGRLAESGTRQQLLAQGGIYASMIRTKREIENTKVVA